MKQHITKEQWDELSDEQKNRLVGILFFDYDEDPRPFNVLIGQMIEFLGDDLVGVIAIYQEHSGVWQIDLMNKTYTKKELVDALWLAVKEKLNVTK